MKQTLLTFLLLSILTAILFWQLAKGNIIKSIAALTGIFVIHDSYVSESDCMED